MNMRKLVVAAVLGVLVVGQAAVADPHRLGAGVRYNRSASTLGDGVDSDGLSYLLSYQLVPVSLIKIEVDAEFMPSSLTGNGTAVIPQLYALLGGWIYAGLGIGMPYMDGEFADDPIYNIRAGLDIPIGSIHFDINANYGFTDFDQLSDFESDNVTVGLIARYEF